MSALSAFSTAFRPTLRRAAIVLLAALLPAPAPLHAADPVKRALVSHVDPEYPPMARQMHLSGAVLLDIVIDKDGKVSEVHVSSGSALLSGAATAAVKKWKYAAADAPTTTSVRVVFGGTD